MLNSHDHQPSAGRHISQVSVAVMISLNFMTNYESKGRTLLTNYLITTGQEQEGFHNMKGGLFDMKLR